ncbi:MAG TPA: DUF302 domain-containing protein [Steroidobacteraceae bacterium]|jgi:uncharacterized protein (DUF302 family)|nr:DUF302 domain-containing protein [Steroidobacteraceae bacterium]
MAVSDHGIIDIRCQGSVSQAIDRLQALATAAGLIVFARIDFSGDAQRAGLSMRPMQALLFGNPKAGTPILVAAPRAGLDLPLRALAWEGADGAVWLSCNAPEYLESRHGFPPALVTNIAGARKLIEQAAQG